MESQSVNKKRIYREWREGDTGYYKGIKGKISIDKDTPTSFKIDWHSENIPPAWTPYTLPSYLTGEGGYITYYECFTLEGKFMKVDENPSLSFLPDEQSMPFDEVEVLDRLPEKYTVRPNNHEQFEKLKNYFSSKLRRNVLGLVDSFFHYPEPSYQSCTYNFRRSGYTLISFEDWERLVKAEKLEKTLKNIETIVKSTLITSELLKEAEKSTTATEKVIDNEGVFEQIKKIQDRLFKTYKGQLKGVPNDIVERMMDCQEEQGNKMDASVFEKKLTDDDDNGGFYWLKTKEGHEIWADALLRKDFQPFYDFWEKEKQKENHYNTYYRHTIIPYSKSTVKELKKNTITNKINKIETKLSKLNDKREKLLERYKSLGR